MQIGTKLKPNDRYQKTRKSKVGKIDKSSDLILFHYLVIERKNWLNKKTKILTSVASESSLLEELPTLLVGDDKLKIKL